MIPSPRLSLIVALVLCIICGPAIDNSRLFAQSLPQGGRVTAGTATIGAPSNGGLAVQQSSNHAVINWQSFSISQGNTVNFVAPSSSSATLNRVTGSTTSSIAGTIKSNGQVFLVNPNGILITPSGVINTAGFVASTLGVSDADFMAGNYNFIGNGQSADVINRGRVKVRGGGAAVLIGGHVENDGSITANRGRVGLASGEQVSVDMKGNGFLTVSVPTSSANQTRALISQTGRIQANGGTVELRAVTSADVASAAINVSGTIEANGIKSTKNGVSFLGPGNSSQATAQISSSPSQGGTANWQKRKPGSDPTKPIPPSGGPKSSPNQTVANQDQNGGSIVIDGGLGGQVVIRGSLSATSSFGKGGAVVVTGNDIAFRGAVVDVSGAMAGGTVQIGGGPRGSGPLQQAATTTVDQASLIEADANVNGNGGDVTVWSQGSTAFAGYISARGGLQGGNGGQVEVSSHGVLSYTGSVNTLAPHGLVGNLLLDPYDVIIQTASGSPTDTCTSGTCTPSGSGSILTVAALQAALASSNVTVTTGSSGSDLGNITVANAITWSSAFGLTLSAANGVILNAGITNSSSSSSLTLTAAGTGGISGSGAIANAGSLTFNVLNSSATGTLSGVISGAGGVAYNGPGTLTLSGINTYTGATTVTAGALQAGSTSAFGTNSAVTLSSGTTLDLAGFSNSIGSLAGTGGTVTNSSSTAATLTTGGSNTSTSFAGVIQNGTGTVSLAQNGSGTLTLSGVNTYTGVTTISAGTLQLGTAGSLGSGTYAGNIAISSGATFEYSSSATQTLSGIISGAGALTKDTSSTSTLTLSGANTFTSGTTIKAGTLSGITSAAAFGTGAITIGDSTGSANATLSVGLAGTFANAISVASGNTGIATITDSAASIFSGAVTLNSHGLTLSPAASALTLSGGVTGTGNLTLNSTGAGVITLSTAAVNNIGTITNSGAGTATNLISAGVGSSVTGITQNSTTSALTVSGQLTSNATATTLTNTAGTKLLTLSGGVANTAGNLILNNNSATASGITLSTSAVNNIGTITNSGSGAGSTLISAGVGSSVTGITQNSTTSALTVSGQLTSNATATTLTNTAGTALLTLSGGVANTAGNLILNNNSATASGITLSTAAVNNIGTITNSGSGAGSTLISSVIGTSVTGVIQNSTASALTLSGANTFTSGTTIKAGTLSGITSAAAFGTGAITIGDSTGSANATLSVGLAGTFANAISVASGNTGIATITDSAASIFSGAVTLNSHGLTLSPAASALTLSGGVTGTGNLTLNSTGAGVITLSTAAVNNIGTITNSGAGTATNLISAGVGSSVTGITQNSTTSALTVSGQLTSNATATTLTNTAGTKLLTLSGGVANTAGNLILNNNSATASGITLSTAAVNNIGTITNSGSGAGSTLISSVIGTSVTGVIQNSTASALTLSGANTFTSGTTIKAGTLSGITSAAAFGTGAITIGDSTGSANATLSVGLAGTFANAISVASGNTGIATITDSAASIFSGAVTLNSHGLTLSPAASALTLSGGVTGTGNLTLNSTGAGVITLSTAAVNNIGTITNSGAGTATNLISAGVGSSVTGITQNSTTSALTVSGQLTSNATATTLTNTAGTKLLTLSGGVANTAGNLILNNNSATASGITLSTSAVNNIGTITNSGSGAGSTLISAGVGSSVTGITQNSTTSALTVSGQLTSNATATTLTNTAGTALLTLSGGVANTAGNLILNNNSATASGITLSTAAVNNIGTITNSGSGAGSTLISSVIGTSVTGVIQNSTASALTLSGANTFTSGTTIKAGTLSGITSAAAFGTGAITIGDSTGSANATLSVGLAGTFANAISVASGNTGIATITDSAASIFSGAVTLNSHGLTLSPAASALTLSGGVTGTGNLTLNSTGAGVITLSTAAVNNIGTITNSGAGTATNLISAGVGSSVTGITQNSTTSALTVSGQLTSNATATTLTNTAGTALLTLSGGVANTAGNLILNNNSATASGITLSTAAVNNIGTITNSGSGAGSTLISSVIGTSVTGVIQNSTASALTLSGANTFTSGTTIKAGTLSGITSAAAFGTGAITIGDSTGSANATLSVGLAGTFANAISVASGNTGIATITDSAASIFSGAVTLNSHGLTLSPAASALTLSGGVTGTGNLTLNSTGAGVITLSTAAVNNIGTITNSGAGTATNLISAGVGSSVTGITQNSTTSALTLSGVNTYTGVTTISAGTLQLGTAGSLGSGTYAGNIAISSGATFEYSSSATQTLSGIISGAGALTKDTSSTSTLTLSGVNTYTGATTVTLGTLTLSGSLNVGSGTATTSVASGATLNGAGVLTAGTLSDSGAGTFSLTGANAIGALATSGSVGAFTFNNAQSIALGSVASAGAVLITATGTTSDVTLSSGTTISSTASGNSVVLAAGRNFINNAGASALSTASGRWLVYSNTPGADTFGSLNSANTAVWNATYSTLPPGSVSESGNRYLFSTQPTLTFTSTNGIKTYGTDATTEVASYYTVGGYQSGVSNAFLGDSSSTAYSGAPSVTSSGSPASVQVTGSPYVINVAAGTLAATSGYALAYNSTGTLTVNKAALTITADNQSMTYGGTMPTLTASYSGFVNGDTSASLATAPTVSSATPATANAGTYNGTLTASGAVGNNYSISYAAGNLTIGKAALTITADNQSMTYGGTMPTLTASYSGFVNGDTSASLATAPTVSSATPATANAGTYNGTLTASGAVGNNYSISYAAGNLTIGKAALTITADNQSMTYGGTMPTLTASYSGFVNGDTSASLATAPTVSSATPATANAGTYNGTLTASGAVGNNYTISYAAGNLTIGKAALTITADNQSMTYGGTMPTLTASYSGFVNGDTSASLATAPTVSSATPATANAGTYNGTLTASGAVGNNYTISYAAGNLTIGKAALTITADNQSMTYGGTMPTLTASYSGFVNGDTSASLATAPTVSSATPATANAGTYNGTLTASGAVGNNYTISYAAGNLTIGKAALTITADNQSMTYGGTMPTLTASYSGFVNGDTSASLATAPTVSSATPATANAGTYNGTLTASGAVGNNYTISYAAGNLTIGKAALTITADNQSMTYGGTMPTLTASYSGFVNGDTSASLATAPTVSSATPATANAGTYNGTLTASGAVGNNYTISYAAGNLTIGKAALTITADNQSMTYGGTMPTLTASYSGFVNGDTSASLATAPTVSSATPATANAGTYNGTLTASGAVGNNYTISYAAGNLTIGKAALTITADNQSMTYGGTMPTLTASYSGFVNGDTSASLATAPTVSSATPATANAGTYNGTLTASGAVGNNYTISYAAGNLTIGKAALTITADNQSMTYGGTMPTLTASYSGFVNGDTSASLATAPTVSSATPATANAGTYNGTLTASGAVGNNYTISYAAGNLTIGKAALTITADNQSMTYGGTMPTLTASYSGFVNGDTSASLATAPTVSSATPATANAGTYNGTLTASGAVGNNYTISYAAGNLTIGKAALTITADNQSMTYGGTMPTLTASYSGFVNGDTSASLATAPTVSSATPATANAGTYNGTLTASGAVGNNYSISYAAGNLTIGKAALTITADNQSMTYGGTMPTLTASYSGFVNGDTSASLATAPTVSSATPATANAGTYNGTLTASGAVGNNYSISYAAGNLTIGKAALTITADNQSMTYGGTMPTLTASYSGFVNGDTSASLATAPTVSSATPATANAGTYNGTLTASGAVGNNYSISYAAGNLTIGKAALTITADNQSMTYGGTMPTLTASYSGFVNGDTSASLATAPTVSSATPATANAGTYNGTLTASGAVGNNYSISYAAGNLTIGKAALTITADNQSMTYGGTMPTLTASYSGFVNGDTSASLATAPTVSSATPATANAGTYNGTLTASGAVGNNYSISYAAGNLTIGKAALTITADNQSMTYGGTMPTLTASYSGFVNGDTSASLATAPTVSSATPATANAGTYNGTLTASGAVGNNYSISYAAGNLTIGKAALTITADNQSMTYGGTMPTLTASYSGFVNGDTSASLATAPTVSSATPATANAGTYNGTLTASGAVGNNYSISYAAGNLTIGKAALTITADNQSMTYGGTMPTLTASYSGFVNGDTSASLATAPTVSSATPATANAGTYNGTLTASGAVGNNYSISYAAGNLTIGKAALTITADNQSMTYGGTMPTLTASYSGFVNGDTSASLATAPTVSSATPATANAGTYNGTLTASGAVGNNYSISYAAGNLTIGKAALTITADNQSMTYGGTMPTLTASYSGFVNGDTSASLATAPTVSSATPATANAGTYNGTLTASGAVGNNYSISYAAGNLTIGKAALTITADNQSRAYGDANPVLTYSVGGSGLINGDVLIGQLSTSATTASGVGNYAINLGTLSNPNYLVSYTGATLSIDPRSISVMANPLSRIYGSINPGLSYSVGGAGLANGDTLSGSLTTAATSASGIGNYAIGQGSLSASSNYTIAYVSNKLAVTPRPLTVTANAVSKSFGAVNPTLNYTIGGAGLVNGDSLSGSLTTAANQGSPVGTYAITQGSLIASPNYALQFYGNYLTVIGAVVPVTQYSPANDNAFLQTALAYVDQKSSPNGKRCLGGIQQTCASSNGR